MTSLSFLPEALARFKPHSMTSQTDIPENLVWCISQLAQLTPLTGSHDPELDDTSHGVEPARLHDKGVSQRRRSLQSNREEPVLPLLQNAAGAYQSRSGMELATPVITREALTACRACSR